MISGCRANTELIKRSFWYSGEILERGIPRNDIFFDTTRHNIIRQRISREYNIAQDSRIVLYAPTFRRSGTLEPYHIDWDKMRPALKRMLQCDNLTVIVRMHPNLINKVDTSSLVNYEGVVDGTLYPDMQELLSASDLLITDYSSSMFDFSMQRRPCLLYATDIEQYDRGYYYDFTKLPYPLARNQEELLRIISEFNSEEYGSRLADFLDNELGVVESGVAAKALAEWMVNCRK
jgi:CDP-glycerol glycerophosphotransferase